MDDWKTSSIGQVQPKENKARRLPQYLASFTVDAFFRGSPISPRPHIPALLHTHLALPSQASIPRSTTRPFAVDVPVSLGAFGQGTVLAWTSPAGLPLLSGAMHFAVTEDQLSWVGALMTLGAAAMVLPMGYVMDRIGRKNSMLLLVVPYVIGWALIIWAASVEMLYTGRFLTGMASGAFAISGPIYTTEIAEKEIRGLLGSFYQNLLVIGVLFTYAVGSVLSPFWLSLVCGAVPILFGATFAFMPETPVFFLKVRHLQMNQPEKARSSLRWLRGPDYDIEQEMWEMQQTVEEEQKSKASLRELFSTVGTVKGLVVSVGLLSLQQMSGVNTATFYTTIIFKEAGSTLSPSHATIIVGACQVVFTLVSGLVVDRLGRKVLLIASDAVMSLCMFALGAFFFMRYTEQDVSTLGWLPVSSVGIFFAAYALGYGPLPWVVMAEVFLPSVKGLAGAASCVVNWLLAFVVTKFFADMVAAFGTHTTFWIFAVLSLLGIAFVYFVVPETKGKTTEEIFKELNGDTAQVKDLPLSGNTNEAFEYELRGRMGLHI
ncbi:hypothetical protein PR048_019752 [Dryococelus australis]|uniref:Major facilitator superfamily (MFS) profile domain-containing protein n=1 Tax=Dryococelus australis TaxID=614101 RepID=A0ABQ9H4D5_9NEOP|nr:hypothetical protein PR048_019752 [Dryococelus australis]